MSETAIDFGSQDHQQAALKSVHAEGRLDGLCLVMSLRQQYRNETRDNLEIVYTFPLPSGASLLGLRVEIGGRRLNGTVIAAPEARERFEDALDAGDTPIMVELAASGLCTANLGNLLPGETAIIELEYAQLLRYEQGRVRLAIPTVIAQRYGDPHAPGRLKPHESAVVDPLASYGFTLRLALSGAIAEARLACPSHRIVTAGTHEGVEVTLERAGVLDRDFILNLEGVQGRSFAARAAEGSGTVVLASFCPDSSEAPALPVALKLLVDCSGSMTGDSIESAKQALHQILQHLGPQDLLSYSRFGSSVVHHHRSLVPVTPANLPALSRLVSNTQADLGGTEMEAALRAVLDDVRAPGSADELSPALLLITDGAAWAVDEIVGLAQRSSQRIFVIGVGSAPGEPLLTQLAEHTGGAYEAVSPNEDMAAAIVRMFHRLRGAKAMQARVEWGAPPVWQSPLPKSIYPGETLHVFATFDQAPVTTPRLLWTADSARADCTTEAFGREAAASLVRLCGARQLALCADPDAATALALRYQLLSPYTNLFLVYERAAGEKAETAPTLQQIGQMHAAGHLGMGTVALHAGGAPMVMSAMCSMPDSDASMLHSFDQVEDLSAFHDLPLGCASYSLPRSEDTFTDVLAMLQFLNAWAPGVRDLSEVVDVIQLRSGYDGPLARAVERMVALGVDEATAWALGLEWLVEAHREEFTLDRHARRLLRAALAKATAEDRNAADLVMPLLFQDLRWIP